MSPPTDLLDVAELLAGVFEGLKVPYAFGGAIAQNFWGTVRATNDVDILAAVARTRFEELRGALEEAGFAARGDRGQPVPLSAERLVSEEREHHLATVHHRLVRAEIFFPFLPLQHSILRRAVPRPLTRRVVPITIAEDLVLLKMAFHRVKDLRDVRGILWIQKGRLDLEYLREWAAQMLSDEHQGELESWIRKYAG
ncbi:MAG: hypothetical protein ACUVYA_18610 [Planctomycetota bacterium]